MRHAVVVRLRAPMDAGACMPGTSVTAIADLLRHLIAVNLRPAATAGAKAPAVARVSSQGVVTKVADAKVGMLTGIGTTTTSRRLDPADSNLVCSGVRLTSYRPSATKSAVPTRATSPRESLTRYLTSLMRLPGYGSPLKVTQTSNRARLPMVTRAGPSTSASAIMGSAKMSQRVAGSGWSSNRFRWTVFSTG